jgi:hypothetical protein
LLHAYVDDIVVAARSTEDVDEIGLDSRRKITELGEVSTILGMKVSRDLKQRTSGPPNLRASRSDSLDIGQRRHRYRYIEERRLRGPRNRTPAPLTPF